MSPESNRIGIYLDISNIERSLADLNCMGMALDYSEMIRQLTGDGELTVLRGYDCRVADGAYGKDIQEKLEAIGVELILSESAREQTGDTTSYRYVQKEVDTGITTDAAWDLAADYIDTAVIVSGDRDMSPVFRRAVREGKSIFIACIRDSIGDKYAESIEGGCIYLDDCEIFQIGGEERSEVMNTVSFVVREKEAVCE